MAVSKLKTRFAVMRQKLGPKGNINYLISKTGLSNSWIKKVSCGLTNLQYRQAKLFELTFGFSADWLLGEDVPMMASDGENVKVKIPSNGMTLRDWFAGMALQGIISGSAHPIFSDHGSNEGLVEESIQSALIDGPGDLDPDSNSIRTIWAWIAYGVADAMIAKRNPKEESND
jgi:hypothetical protein